MSFQLEGRSGMEELKERSPNCMPCSTGMWKMIVFHLAVFDSAFCVVEAVSLGITLSHHNPNVPDGFAVAEISNVALSLVLTLFSSFALIYAVCYEYKVLYIPYIFVKVVRIVFLVILNSAKLNYLISGGPVYEPSPSSSIRNTTPTNIRMESKSGMESYIQRIPDAVEWVARDPQSDFMLSVVSTAALAILSYIYEVFALVWVSLALKYQESPWWGEETTTIGGAPKQMKHVRSLRDLDAKYQRLRRDD
ncbi:unnamed protein product [Cyprideis torosa]|uniref:Uncharacterized protein n=1 Tax=Cyprideis torosa TaxID=163714 RepID=A0A7R8ZSN8_9CRUS|nr:unnamed protein product [Cyprideis torosa]CAG0902165.1 unnamed protein product [Cyprideis torosa]